MARKKLITRTFQFTKALVKVIDRVGDDKPRQIWLSVIGTYEGDAELLEAIQKELPEDVVPLCIMSKEETLQKCSMTQENFVRNSALQVTLNEMED